MDWTAASVVVAAVTVEGGVLWYAIGQTIDLKIAQMLTALDEKFVADDSCRERRTSCQAIQKMATRNIDHRLLRIERVENGRLREATD
jgi:uncharacterized protein YdgA (DUF945 family)